MTLASIGGWTVPVPDWIYYPVVVAVALVVTYIVARLVARFAGDQLRQRHVRGDMVVLGKRVVTAVVVVLGIFTSLGFAAQNANVTLFGLLLATIVAALGIQQLLQDFVSGYYVLLERHIRIGDRIEFDGHEGTITDVRLRVTLLRNEDGDTVVVPNSELFTKPVTIRARAEATRSAPPK
ncbi:MAG TPA: mechanosensitive ion channel domain-containing protein [Candidatus Dormibacteraeota bacterium]|nr:mechanosensitive ion channel domain-containing protein [Candidatus Dormibacteraeota bacterium]